MSSVQSREMVQMFTKSTCPIHHQLLIVLREINQLGLFWNDSIGEKVHESEHCWANFIVIDALHCLSAINQLVTGSVVCSLVGRVISCISWLTMGFSSLQIVDKTWWNKVRNDLIDEVSRLIEPASKSWIRHFTRWRPFACCDVWCQSAITSNFIQVNGQNIYFHVFLWWYNVKPKTNWKLILQLRSVENCFVNFWFRFSKVSDEEKNSRSDWLKNIHHTEWIILAVD